MATEGMSLEVQVEILKRNFAEWERKNKEHIGNWRGILQLFNMLPEEGNTFGVQGDFIIQGGAFIYGAILAHHSHRFLTKKIGCLNAKFVLNLRALLGFLALTFCCCSWRGILWSPLSFRNHPLQFFDLLLEEETFWGYSFFILLFIFSSYLHLTKAFFQ